MTVQVVRVVEALPEGLERLRDAARAEGVRIVDRLQAEWAEGRRFDGPDEALFAAYVDGELAGVGGVAAEPRAEARRMRNLYVAPAFRRRGVGRALAAAMIQQGTQASARLTCNAAASPAAAPFWEAQGFAPEPGDGGTHALAVP